MFPIRVSGGGFTVADCAGFEVSGFLGFWVSWFPEAGFRGAVFGECGVYGGTRFFRRVRFSGDPQGRKPRLNCRPTTTMIRPRCPGRSTLPCSAFSPPFADSLSRHRETPMTRPPDPPPHRPDQARDFGDAGCQPEGREDHCDSVDGGDRRVIEWKP